MDTNSVTTSLGSLVPYAPVLALVGALITFFNSRLNEAKTRKAKKEVWVTTLFLLDMMVFVAGSFFCFSDNFFKLGTLLLVISGIFGCISYYYGKQSDSKRAVVLLALRLHVISLAIPVGFLAKIAPILSDVVKIVRAPQ